MSACGDTHWGTAWNRFWFREDPGYTIALVRVLVGSSLVLKLSGATGLFRLGAQDLGLPKRGVFPVAAMLDTFRAPYPLFEWLPAPSAFWFARIEDALLALAILVTIGCLTRIAVPLLATLYAYVFFLSQFNFYHHLYFFLLVLWVLALNPCATWLSIDALMQRGSPRAMTTVLPVRLVQVIATMVYVFTFAWKVDSGWLDGSVIASFEEAGVFKGAFASSLLRTVGDRGVAWLTLGVEAALPVALWLPRARRVAILAGTLLHLGIDLTMHVNSFGYQMIAAYAAFLHPIPGATVVLYDGYCPVCRHSRRVGITLDWLRRVSWLDFRVPEVRAALPDMNAERLEREMLVIAPDGSMRAGFDGWRFLLGSFPVTFIPSFLLYLWPLPAIGRKLYRYVADRRGGACELTPRDRLPQTEWRRTLEAARRTVG